MDTMFLAMDLMMELQQPVLLGAATITMHGAMAVLRKA
jgi:hypothetical protein